VDGEVWEASVIITDKSAIVRFYEAPPKPQTDGQDNVSIKYESIFGDQGRIMNCTIFQVFDNRVFASGNPQYPNVVWHSGLNDATYWSDLDYYNEGSDGSAVKGLVAGNNALWVFKEPSPDNASVFYHVPTIDSEYGKIYPSAHSSIATGCIGKATNFNDDIVFFGYQGMEGVSGDITTEQFVSHRSSLINSKLLNEKHYQNMTYKIKEEEIDGDKAEVTVEIKVTDFRYALQDANIYLNEHPEEFNDDKGNYDPSKYIDYRLQKLNETKDTVTYTIELQLTKVDETWKVDTPDVETLDKINGIYNY